VKIVLPGKAWLNHKCRRKCFPHQRHADVYEWIWVTYHTDTLEGLTRKYELVFKLGDKGDTLLPLIRIFCTIVNDESGYGQSEYKALSRPRCLYFYRRAAPEKQDVENVQKVDTLDFQNLCHRRFHQLVVQLKADSLQLGTQHEGYDRK
jgi:hypothetical protein